MACSLLSSPPTCSLLPLDNFDFRPPCAMPSAMTQLGTSLVPSHMNITTVAAANGLSTLECWQLSAPFTQSSTPGIAGALNTKFGESGASSLTIIPPHFDGGLHNAPAVQFVAFVSGVAVLTLPNSTDTAIFYGGRSGMALATDTKNVSELGHTTVYPGKEETIALLIPTRNNEIPAHTVLHSGPCSWEEMP